MPRFAYQAKGPKGVQSGEIEASNEAEVRVRLRAQNLELIRTMPAGSKQGGSAQAPVRKTGTSVNSKDLQIFTRQLATLINAGIPIVDSMKILADGAKPGVLKDGILSVKAGIESGRRLAEAMERNPQVFDRLYVNMIKAGEEAGILDSILARLAVYMEKSEKIKGQVKGALVYPGVIIAVAGLVIAGILFFVIPRFQEFYSAAGKEPPALTMAVVGFSHFLTKRWYFVLAAMVGGPYLFLNWIRTPDGKDAFDTFLMKAPIFGDVIQKSSVARLTRTMSTLLSSGVGMIEAIDISARTADNVVIENALLRSKDSVIAGRTFSSPLMKEKVIPDMVVQMITIGESSGNLDTMLGKIADFYEEEVETAIKTMTSLIEPLLMVVLGGIIAFLVVAMYLPVFSMGDVIK